MRRNKMWSEVSPTISTPALSVVLCWFKTEPRVRTQASNMSSGGTFVDKIDPFAKRTSLKKKQKKSQGSSRYRTGGDVELTALPLLKGNSSHCTDPDKMTQFALPLLTPTGFVVTMQWSVSNIFSSSVILWPINIFATTSESRDITHGFFSVEDQF